MMDNKRIAIGYWTMMAGMAMAVLDSVGVNAMGHICFGVGVGIFLRGVFG